jgi:hypothetical protein
MYTRDVLAFGGFFEQADGLVMQSAFSSQHALDPALFDQLEEYYYQEKNKSSLDRVVRRLLFDAVDEILSAQLLKRPAAAYNNKLPWLLPQSSRGCFYSYTGKKLLEQVWAQLSYFHGRFAEPEMVDVEGTTKPSSSSSSPPPPLLEEDIAVMELWREPRAWAHGEAEVQSVAIELERLICADMIREFVREHHRPRATRRQEEGISSL